MKFGQKMSVEIVGQASGAERQAAETMAKGLQSRLNAASRLVIVVGARCFGFDIQDIDLLVLGTFGRGIEVGKGNERSVRLVNLALVIEVKDHSGDRVRFSSQHVHVRYRSGWEDATQKAFSQAKTLPKFLSQNAQATPWVESLVWLPNYDGRVPSSICNVLHGEFNADKFFSAIKRIRPPRGDKKGLYISFATNHKLNELQELQEVQDFFTQTIPTTDIDRKRVEAICKRLIADQKYVERLGSQLLVFRGRAGSGKTIHLLRLAKDLYDIGNRVLLLTFNKALVADVRRLLRILGIPDEMERGVRISTAHKFFIDMLQARGYWKIDNFGSDFPQHEYQNQKLKLLELLRGEDAKSLKQGSLFQNKPNVFGWDYILVDEAQDWPEEERDLLYTTFGSERIVIADGVDQLLRRQSPCDWLSAVLRKQIVPLRKALRMGSSLCRFIEVFANELGLEWNQELNEENRTGEITIIEGPYTLDIHDKIMQRHGNAGNEPIDALFCVPSSKHSSEDALPDRLLNWGYSVWDGTASDVRDSYPTAPEEHRVVNYQSCRGLEGWTVICLGLDVFNESCFRAALKTPPPELTSVEENARLIAGRYTLIPLTRAMQHLVIQLDGPGKIYDVCRKLHHQFSDLVEWQHTGLSGH